MTRMTIEIGKEALYEKLCYKSQREIAKELNIATSTLCTHIQEVGIKVPTLAERTVRRLNLDKEWIYDKLITQFKTKKEVTKLLKIPISSLNLVLKHYKLDYTEEIKQNHIRKCEYCSTEYTPSRKDQYYCTDQCQRKAYSKAPYRGKYCETCDELSFSCLSHCKKCTTTLVRPSQKVKKRIKGRGLSDSSQNVRAREWQKNNRNRANLHASAYRARKRARNKELYGTSHSPKQAKKRNKRKSIRKSLKLNRVDLEVRLNLFGNLVCAYCNKTCTIPKHNKDFSKDTRTFDHLVPLELGGTNELNNLYCACMSCNGCKMQHPWKEWFRRQPFYSKERESQIANFNTEV